MSNPVPNEPAEWTARLDLLQQQLDVLAAKDEIRDVLYRYARAVDRKDEELLKSCYHSDGVDAHWSFIGNGREFAEEILKPHQMGQVPNFKHFITNILIEVSGDRAFCESSYLFSQTLWLDEGQASTLTNEGRYLDVFERFEGEWRIRWRLLVPEAGGWSFPIMAPGAEGLPIPNKYQRAASFPDDPVYRGFAISEIMPENFRTTADNWGPAIAHLRRLAGLPVEEGT